LSKCRRRVKRLARDLPTFDSVWVDALVQARRLTPFQAQWLESGTPERLAVGPCVLVERISSDGRFTHYRGRLRDSRQPVTVTAVERDLEAPAAGDRLRALTLTLRGFLHPGLLIPTGCGVESSRPVAISPWVDGVSLHDLLIRRGRFAPNVVCCIAAQLADALSALQQHDCVHGDVRLRNVRLTRRGQAVLLNTGLVPALWPELTIHADLPPDCYDAVAPELIGSGKSANVASDLYALGCVLWELLAGRPPFPHGDPLTKLAAHQTMPVPDVRTWAPDTPHELAALIVALTAREPGQRPASFHDVGLRLRNGRRRARRRLRAFHASFSRPAGTPGAERRRALVRRTVATAGLLGAAVIGVGLLDTGARSELLSIAASGPADLRDKVSRLVRPDAPDKTGALPQPPRLSPFPTQIDQGVLTLDQPGPYAAGEIAAAGPLRIRGTGDVRPVVLVRDKPLRVWAGQLILENVDIRRDGDVTDDSVPLLAVDAQSLGVRQCAFGAMGSRQSAAIAWSPLDEAAATQTRILLSKSLFYGAGAAFQTRGALGSLEMDHVLKLGAGPLVQLGAGQNGPRGSAIVLRHSTLRSSGGLVRFDGDTSAAAQAGLTLEDCVLDVPAASGALLEFVAPSAPPGWQRRVRITGENTLVRPGTLIAAIVERTPGTVQELPADQIAIDGLLTSDIVFAGSESPDPRDSAVSNRLGHGRSIQPPGIDPNVFVAEPPGSYNSPGQQTPNKPTRVPAP
jgi:serine/threonine-protein kinase